MQQLKNDILRGNTFGKAKALTYRAEFQKRGLPHVHMLARLEDEALTKDRHRQIEKARSMGYLV